MIFCDYKDFPKKQGRLLGLDWGMRRCGVAVSDEGRNMVFVRPQINVKSQNELVESVLGIIATDSITGIVLGLPLFADGSDSDTTRAVREFADMLAKQTDVPILFMEENLTSIDAQQEIGRPNIKKIKQELDSLSARIILENAICVLKRN